MLYFLPDSNDKVDPTFDFKQESRSPDRLPRDDLYAHEILDRPYDGILISYGMIKAGTYAAPSRRRFLREGARAFYRAPDWCRFMGDCGAFTYAKAEAPPYSVDEVASFYAETGVDFGISVDHIVFDYDAQSKEAPTPEARQRYDLTLALARDFLEASKPHSYTPLGAVHGWSPESYAAAAIKLQRMGYRYLALGGLVRLRAELERVVAAVSAVRRADTRLHLLGVARLDQIATYAAQGVASVDSTSPLRQAWLSARHNYHVDGERFAALRIPDATSSRVRAKISDGSIDQTKLIQLEARALDAVDKYARRQQPIGPTIEALLEYQALHSPGDDRRKDYTRTLEARPWERCSCSICVSLGHHVTIFRGAERNRRRGFHNVRQFYTSFLRELKTPDLVIVGCGFAKRINPAPARELYIGSAFKAGCKVASRYRSPMRILSFKYGLLHPDEIIEPYDATPSRATPEARLAWARMVAEQVQDFVPADGRIVVLAGAKYLTWIDKLEGIEVELPFDGKTLGERLAFAAGPEPEIERPKRTGKLIRWDFFWTTFRSRLRRSDDFREYWSRAGARTSRLELPEDMPLDEAILAARDAGLFGKGTTRTGCFEVQNDHGIYYSPEGYLNLRLAKPKRVRFISWAELEQAESTGTDDLYQHTNLGQSLAELGI